MDEVVLGQTLTNSTLACLSLYLKTLNISSLSNPSILNSSLLKSSLPDPSLPNSSLKDSLWDHGDYFQPLNFNLEELQYMNQVGRHTHLSTLPYFFI